MGLESFVSGMVDKFRGRDGTVHHSEFMGGWDSATGKDTHGNEAYVSRMANQTIVRTHDETIIMSGNSGGSVINNYRRGEDASHPIDPVMADQLKQVVDTAIKGGRINPQEFRFIEQVADHAADTRPMVAQAKTHQGPSGGRG